MAQKFRMLTLTFLLLVVSVTPTFAQSGNIVQTAAAANFNILAAALEAGGLAGILSGGEYTVFAPTDGAFNTLISSRGQSVEQFLADRNAVRDILRYHVIPGKFTIADIERNGFPDGVETLQGAFLYVDVNQGNSRIRLNVGQATIIYGDVLATNGVLHALDNVLRPPNNVTNPVPLFSEPTAQADSPTRVPTAQVNLPTQVPASMQSPVSTPSPQTLLELALAADEMSLFITSMRTAELLNTLQYGNYTVFVPSNAAFDRFPPQIDMTAPEVYSDAFLLEQVMEYHIVWGALSTADIINVGSVRRSTVNGQVVTIAADGSTIQITDTNGDISRVITPNIAGRNGVIHIVDRVLVPYIEEPNPFFFP